MNWALKNQTRYLKVELNEEWKNFDRIFVWSLSECFCAFIGFALYWERIGKISNPSNKNDKQNKQGKKQTFRTNELIEMSTLSFNRALRVLLNQSKCE